MDIPPTQVYEDEDFIPTQKISYSTQQEDSVRQVGILTIGSSTYPINKGVNKIGRHPGCNIILSHQTVSKVHAEIEASADQVSAWICDLDSSNKTKLNNLILRPGRCYELKDGSIIDFGQVRAVYKIYRQMDDSMVPETQVYLPEIKPQQVIPGTPDSSLNNSSALEGDISAIPATPAMQDPTNSSVFRRPPLPPRYSASSSKKSLGQDSSANDISDSAILTAQESSNTSEKGISIYDMETQKPFESDNESSVDIHDVETQKICFDKMKSLKDNSTVKSKTEQMRIDIHDLETQHDVGDIHDLETQGDIEDTYASKKQVNMDDITALQTQKNIVDLHDIETQKEDDIHNLKTPKLRKITQVIKRQNLEGNDESVIHHEHDETSEEDDDIYSMRTQKLSNESAQIRSHDKVMQVSCQNENAHDECKNDDNVSNNVSTSKVSRNDTVLSKGPECDTLEPLKLSLTSEFNEEYPVLERSINLLAPENLMLHFMDNDMLANDKKTKTSTPAKTPAVNGGNETSDKSTDEENIYDVATQPKNDNDNIFYAETQRVDYKIRPALSDDDSDTDVEGVFLRYSRKENGRTSSQKSQSKEKTLSDSDDSATDKEDHFADIAMKQKRNSLNSSALNQSDKKQAANDAGSSRDSDDLFDIPTQHANDSECDDANTPNVPLKIAAVDKDKVSGDKISAQNVQRESVNERTKDNRLAECKTSSASLETTEIDDFAPTQIIQRNRRASLTRKSKSANRTMKIRSEEDSVTEDLPGQIDAPKSPLNNGNNSLQNSPEQQDFKSNEEYSFVDMDYEMAPTQLISETEIKRKESVSSKNKNDSDESKRSKSSNKVNLNDTLERNLNEMFDDVNESAVDEQIIMSTQTLHTVLQLSQDTNQLSDNESSANENVSLMKDNNENRSISENIRESPSLGTKSRLSITKSKGVDSQNSDEFTNLKSRRKRNVLAESQAESSEQFALSRNVGNTANGNTNTAANYAEDNAANSTTRKSKTENIQNLSLKENVNSEMIANEVSSQKDDKVQETHENGSTKSLEKVNDHCNMKPPPESSTVSQDEDDDPFLGLPEVSIAGTLSNPASPASSTSSDFQINMNCPPRRRFTARNSRTQEVPPRKKSSRRNLRGNIEDGELHRSTSDSQSSTFLRNNSFSGNHDVDKVSSKIIENNNLNEKPNHRRTKQSARKTLTEKSLKSERKSKDAGQEQNVTDSVELPKIVTRRNSAEYLKRNSSIRNIANTLQDKNDPSSVFQVAKDDKSVVSSTNKPTRKRGLSAPFDGRKLVNAISKNESEHTDTKKRKIEKISERPASASKTRRSNAKPAIITNKRHSSNILDFLTKRNSPTNTDSSQSSTLSQETYSSLKQAVVNVVKLSPNMEMEIINDNLTVDEIKHNRLDGSKRKQSLLNRASTSAKENSSGNGVQQESALRRSSKRRKAKLITPPISEESQEVAMIMQNASVTDEGNSVITDKKENANESIKNSKSRRGIKRANTNTSSESDVTENSSLTSTGESDNSQFEVPTMKAKRGRPVKNTSLKKDETSTGRVSRSTRGSQQSLINSTLDSSEDNNRKSISKNVKQIGSDKPRGRPRKRKESITVDKKGEEVASLDKSSSSGLDNSILNMSIMSTSSRTRRSMSSSLSNASQSKHKQKVLFTGVSSNEYSKVLSKLGGSQVEDFTNCTVLVTDKVRRTVKFLCALARAIPIVSTDWLIESGKAGCFVDIEDYILRDQAAEAKFDFTLRASLEKASQRKFLEGYTIIITPNVAPPPIPELKIIISSCGGKPLIRPPTTWSQNTVILSREEDLTNAKKFLSKAPQTVTIQSTEFILTGILRQEIDLIKYQLR